MSIKGSFSAECPSCGLRFDADFWTVIHGDQDPDLKDALVSGEFDLLMCPGCSRIFPGEETFIYMSHEKELLVFVMPADRIKEREKWLEKMRQDYEALRGASPKADALPGEPLYYFGTGMLTDLLLRDRDREEETDVMEFMAGERGFKSARVSPGFARRHDLPFSLPYAGCPCREHALSAARSILAANDALGRVKNLVSTLEGLKTQDLAFIKK